MGPRSGPAGPRGGVAGGGEGGGRSATTPVAAASTVAAPRIGTARARKRPLSGPAPGTNAAIAAAP